MWSSWTLGNISQGGEVWKVSQFCSMRSASTYVQKNGGLRTAKRSQKGPKIENQSDVKEHLAPRPNGLYLVSEHVPKLIVDHF